MKFFLISFIFLCSSFTEAKSEDVVIGMGDFKPYYISDGQTGIVADIISAVFAEMPEYTPVYRFGLSVRSLWKLYEKKKIDAASNLFDSVEIKTCRTEPLLQFNDVAISLVESKYKIDKLQDLKGKRIVAFEGAKVFFGEKFSSAIEGNEYYEFPKQRNQARMLDNKRADVSVGDLYIFLQAFSEIQNKQHSPKDFKIHRIFPQIASRMAFHNETICNEFNSAFMELKKSGEYKKIYDNYLMKLGFK